MWDKNKHWIYFLVIGILILSAWYSTFKLIPYLIDLNFSESGNNKPGYGEFGDMFGAVNAIFSGLAFAGIIITILLQKTELREQRRELKETREEFQIGRITNIIFKQIDRIDNTARNLIFESFKNKDKAGIIGLYDLNKQLRSCRYEDLDIGKEVDLSHTLNFISIGKTHC